MYLMISTNFFVASRPVLRIGAPPPSPSLGPLPPAPSAVFLRLFARLTGCRHAARWNDADFVRTPIVWNRKQTVYPEAIHHDDVDAEMRRHPRWEVPGPSAPLAWRVRAFRQAANVWRPASFAAQSF